MSSNEKSNAAIESPAQDAEAPTLAALMARMEALEAQNAVLAAENATLHEAAKPGAPEAPFVPVLTYVLRPRGWVADGQSEAFASSEAHVAVQLQRYRNGKARWISGGQSGFTRAQLEALRDHADTLLAAFDA